MAARALHHACAASRPLLIKNDLRTLPPARACVYGWRRVHGAAHDHAHDDDDPHRRLRRVRRNRSAGRARADRPDRDRLSRGDARRHAVRVDPVRADPVVPGLRNGRLARVGRQPHAPDQADRRVRDADHPADRVLRVRRLAVVEPAEQDDQGALPAARRNLAARAGPVPRIGVEPSRVLHRKNVAGSEQGPERVRHVDGERQGQRRRVARGPYRDARRRPLRRAGGRPPLRRHAGPAELQDHGVPALRREDHEHAGHQRADHQQHADAGAAQQPDAQQPRRVRMACGAAADRDQPDGARHSAVVPEPAPQPHDQPRDGRADLPHLLEPAERRAGADRAGQDVVRRRARRAASGRRGDRRGDLLVARAQSPAVYTRAVRPLGSMIDAAL
ncbi:hypothetical protein BVI2075_620042 [Burkholderia vietnamiensis]|nr:hypothetical protein BVI2075_620042 [Burkholderia vietnamiensis]